MSYIITFLSGCVTGVVLLAIIMGGTQSDKIKEAYNTGFKDGLMNKK